MEENEVFNHNVCKANISFAKGEFHPSKTDFTHPKGWISLHNSKAVVPLTQKSHRKTTPQKVGSLEGKSRSAKASAYLCTPVRAKREENEIFTDGENRRFSTSEELSQKDDVFAPYFG